MNASFLFVTWQAIFHVPGKQLLTADTFSRAPLKQTDLDAQALEEEVETFISEVMQQSAETYLNSTERSSWRIVCVPK